MRFASATQPAKPTSRLFLASGEFGAEHPRAPLGPNPRSSRTQALRALLSGLLFSATAAADEEAVRRLAAAGLADALAAAAALPGAEQGPGADQWQVAASLSAVRRPSYYLATALSLRQS